MELYIGLMSGTSADGIDAVLVDFSQHPPHLMATHYTSYSPLLREKILSLCTKGEDEIERLGELDHLLGQAFAASANEIIKQHSISQQHIKAIGSHGQTIRHRPHQVVRFTIQIGDPNIIVAETGITTVADFRRKDIALGGQGAPLVPAFHQAVFSSSINHRAIVNIGGIANITILPKDPSIMIGYDTGPGNTLMDAWINQHQKSRHDEQGKWAATGKVDNKLLSLLLADHYFHLSPPKSTGREYFNLNWLNQYLSQLAKPLSPVDIQTTLAELTAQTIMLEIKKQLPDGEILVCGGGVQNNYLMLRLHQLAQPQFTVSSTESHGIHPDWVEAMAFAWLAKQTLDKKPGNSPAVTGAKQAAILGGIYYA